MSQEHADRLVEYCQQRAGEQVRSVIRYAKEDFEIAYLRSDLEEQYTRKRLANVVEIGRRIHRIRVRLDTEETPLGRAEASVRTYEKTIVLQIPIEQQRGVLATFDPAVGRDLLAFIDECQEHVLDQG